MSLFRSFALLSLLALQSLASPLLAPSSKPCTAASCRTSTTTPSPSMTTIALTIKGRDITFYPAFPDATTISEKKPPATYTAPPQPTHEPSQTTPSALPTTSTTTPIPSTPSNPIPPPNDSMSCASSPPSTSPAITPLPVAGSCTGLPAVADIDGIECLGVSTVPGCSDACWDDPTCEAFAVSADGLTCLVYSRSVATMTRRDGGGVLVYGKECLFEGEGV